MSVGFGPRQCNCSNGGDAAMFGPGGSVLADTIATAIAEEDAVMVLFYDSAKGQAPHDSQSKLGDMMTAIRKKHMFYVDVNDHPDFAADLKSAVEYKAHHAMTEWSLPEQLPCTMIVRNKGLDVHIMKAKHHEAGASHFIKTARPFVGPSWWPFWHSKDAAPKKDATPAPAPPAAPAADAPAEESAPAEGGAKQAAAPAMVGPSHGQGGHKHGHGAKENLEHHMKHDDAIVIGANAAGGVDADDLMQSIQKIVEQLNQHSDVAEKMMQGVMKAQAIAAIITKSNCVYCDAFKAQAAESLKHALAAQGVEIAYIHLGQPEGEGEPSIDIDAMIRRELDVLNQILHENGSDVVVQPSFPTVAMVRYGVAVQKLQAEVLVGYDIDAGGPSYVQNVLDHLEMLKKATS